MNGEVEGPDSFAYNQVCATGNVLLSSNGYTLKYTIDTANVGQEGAPIFKRSGGVDYIAGINCLTIKNDNGSCIGNQGRYITKALYELIVSLKGWYYLEGARCWKGMCAFWNKVRKIVLKMEKIAKKLTDYYMRKDLSMKKILQYINLAGR